MKILNEEELNNWLDGKRWEHKGVSPIKGPPPNGLRNYDGTLVKGEVDLAWECIEDRTQIEIEYDLSGERGKPSELPRPEKGMQVSLEYLEWVLEYLAGIESRPLDKIRWMRNGEQVDVTPELIEEWKYIGLNNRDFAKTHLMG